MKKLFSVLSFLLIIVQFSYAQKEFQQYISKADSAYNVKDYVMAGQFYRTAFEFREEDKIYNGQFYNAACTFSLANDADESFKYLDKAIQYGWWDIAWMKKDSDFDNVRSDKRWKETEAKMQAAIDEYEKDLDKPLRKEIFAMRDKDQGMRREVRAVEKEHGRQSEEMTKIWEKVNAVDDRNTARMEEIIDERGWPGKSLIGEDGSHAAWLVIQHSDLEYQAKWLPILKAAVDEGEASLRNYAFLLDRVNMRVNKKQIYGTQRRSYGNGEMQIYPIEDAYAVNERRAKAGMPPLHNFEPPTKEAYLKQVKEDEIAYGKHLKEAQKLAKAKKYEASGEQFIEMFKLGITKPAHIYEYARVLALDGKTDMAFRSLTSALAGGWSNTKLLKKGKAFKKMRKDPRWKKLMQLAK